MTESRRFRLTLFTMVYVVQGVGLAYFSNFQKPYLDGLGISPGSIGALTFVLQIPFILKVFAAMISDRVNLLGMGHRKPYMIFGLVGAGIAFSAAALVLPSRSFTGFAVLIVVGALSVTLFDSTSDGLAIDLTPHHEQGLVQGVMVAGKALAFILLSLVFGALVQRIGYQVVFPIIGVSMLLPLLWVVRVREPLQRDVAHRFQWSAFRELGKPKFLAFAVYAVVYSIGSFGADGLAAYSLSSRFAASERQIGLYGAMRGIGAVLGALLAGMLIDAIGRKRSAFGGTILVSVGAALLGAALSAPMLVGLGLLWGVVWACQETVFFALAMDIADARIAASMFAIMMALSNFGAAAADGVATALSGTAVGFSGVFWSLATVNLLTILVVAALFKVAPEMTGPRDSAVKGTESVGVAN